MAEIKIIFDSDANIFELLERLGNKEKTTHQKVKIKRGGYIYVLPNEDHSLFKIGWTTNLEQRKKQLKTGLPYDIKFLHVIETSAPGWAEQQLHDKYDGKRESGEWFRLDEEDLAELQAIKTFFPPPPKRSPQGETSLDIAAALVAAKAGFGRTRLQSLLEEWGTPITNSVKAGIVRDIGREILEELQQHGYTITQMLI